MPVPGGQVETPVAGQARLVSVAVPIPALGLLTYRVPEGRTIPARGVRVIVPLGSRSLTGIVVGEAGIPDADVEVRELGSVLDDQPFLPRDVMELTDWVGDYYLAGPGAALSIAMPPHALSEPRRRLSHDSPHRLDRSGPRCC